MDVLKPNFWQNLPLKVDVQKLKFWQNLSLETPSFSDRRLELRLLLVADQQTEGVSVTNCAVTEETRRE